MHIIHHAIISLWRLFCLLLSWKNSLSYLFLFRRKPTEFSVTFFRVGGIEFQPHTNYAIHILIISFTEFSWEAPPSWRPRARCLPNSMHWITASLLLFLFLLWSEIPTHPHSTSGSKRPFRNIMKKELKGCHHTTGGWGRIASPVVFADLFHKTQPQLSTYRISAW